MGKNKIIYLLHEGLPSTIIDSQVLSHVQAMKRAQLIIEVWSYACTRKSFKEAKLRVSLMQKEGECSVFVFRGVRPAAPFSGLMNAVLFSIALLRNGGTVGIVHARTELSASVAALVKKFFQFKLIWDARGDAYSEAKLLADFYPWHKKKLLPYKLYNIKKRRTLSMKKSDFAMFVSEELRQAIAPDYPESRSAVIPCCADGREFFFDSDLRRNKRKSLGISDQDFAVIYCGSLTEWQCFQDIADKISQLLEIHSTARFIILTPSVEDALTYLPRSIHPRVIGKFVGLGEVNAFMNAADVAILIREDNKVNRVASPVKHAEYCMAGLPIIMTRAVRSTVRISEKLGNGIFKFDPMTLPEKISDTERAQLSKRAAEMVSRQKINPTYLNIYSYVKKLE